MLWYFALSLLSLACGYVGGFLARITRYRSWLTKAFVFAGLLLAMAIAMLIVYWVPARNTWTEYVWPWLSAWLQTPGFAGLFALSAAGLTVLVTLRKHRREVWWERTQWALDYLVDVDSTADQRFMALNALDALQQSHLTKTEEQSFIDSVLGPILDPFGDGIETDDLADAADVPDMDSTDVIGDTEHINHHSSEGDRHD